MSEAKTHQERTQGYRALGLTPAEANSVFDAIPALAFDEPTYSEFNKPYASICIMRSKPTSGQRRQFILLTPKKFSPFKGNLAIVTYNKRDDQNFEIRVSDLLLVSWKNGDLIFPEESYPKFNQAQRSIQGALIHVQEKGPEAVLTRSLEMVKSLSQKIDPDFMVC